MTGKDASGVMPALATVDARDVVRCQVAAYGAVQAGAAQVAAWRRQPLRSVDLSLPANFLKNSDPQTIAGLAALDRAIHQHRLDLGHSQDWGVIAAPCLLGRSALALACQRFAVEGAWAISPNLIPHHSLHAVSGTISQALNLRGPNFGIGGGPAAAAEGFLLAATLLANRTLPGLWLVLTGYEPELMPLDPSLPALATPAGPEPLCEAVALALTPGHNLDIGLTLRIGCEGSWDPDEKTSQWPSFHLHTLAALLSLPAANSAGLEKGVRNLAPQRPQGCFAQKVPDPFPQAGRWRLATGSWIELKG